MACTQEEPREDMEASMGMDKKKGNAETNAIQDSEVHWTEQNSHSEVRQLMEEPGDREGSMGMDLTEWHRESVVTQDSVVIRTGQNSHSEIFQKSRLIQSQPLLPLQLLVPLPARTVWCSGQDRTHQVWYARSQATTVTTVTS